MRQLSLLFRHLGRWQRRLGLSIAILTVGGLLGWCLRQQAQSVPDVVFTTITGEQLKLSALRNHPVVVTFWATSCPPCIKEIPHLVDLYRRYHARGLEMVAVAMQYDVPSHVVTLAREQQLPYRVALDLQAAYAQAFGNVQWTPTTFLIAPSGQVVEKTIGAFDLPDLQTQIENYL